MLCCGMFALLAAALLGAWRRLRGIPRLALALVGVLLAGGPVVALTTIAPTDSAMMSAYAWASTMHALCGHRNETGSIQAKDGELR
ncbi:MAG: hypothetical protein JWM91_2007 [Rhodospirillales bacterium]|nr:hypothetical protein [Rhodospirillales bacterium]